MKIKISDLKKVSELILEHILVDWNISCVEIPDFYWDLVGPDRTKWVKPPPVPGPHNLKTEDWPPIDTVLSEHKGNLAALVPLSKFLRAVGDIPDLSKAECAVSQNERVREHSVSALDTLMKGLEAVKKGPKIDD